MKRTGIAALAALSLVATSPAWAGDAAKGDPTDSHERRAYDAKAHDADNTGRNVRDRNDNKLTPLDQGNSKQDLSITQAIRKAVVADDNLSVNAHNVKIITNDAVVTLRGPVKDAKERDAVAAIATATDGVKRVNNELEVEGNP